MVQRRAPEALVCVSSETPVLVRVSDRDRLVDVIIFLQERRLPAGSAEARLPTRRYCIAAPNLL
jgi:hypothetical protein